MFYKVLTTYLATGKLILRPAPCALRPAPCALSSHQPEIFFNPVNPVDPVKNRL